MKKQQRNDIVARADDAFKSANFAEYSVEKTKEGSYKLKRLMMIFAYAALFAAIIAVIAVINGLSGGALGMFAVVLFALAPLGVWIMVHFTWCYVCIEYKYIIDHGDFTAYTVYGGKHEKLLYSLKVRDFTRIAPLNDEYRGEYDAFCPDETVVCAPSLSSYDLYYALTTSESGKKTAVIFQVTNHSLKALKYYNREALVMTEASR